MKYTLYLKQNLPFASAPCLVELAPERILCNDVTLPGDFNPHNTRLWVIGNEYGALGAVWAQHESDALDELVDADLGGGLLIDASDSDEDTTYLGNASEPADLSHAWLAEVDLHATHNKHVLDVLLKFAEARGAGHDTLDF